MHNLYGVAYNPFVGHCLKYVKERANSYQRFSDKAELVNTKLTVSVKVLFFLLASLFVVEYMMFASPFQHLHKLNKYSFHILTSFI